MAKNSIQLQPVVEPLGLFILNYLIILFLSNIRYIQLCQMFYRGQLCESDFHILDHKQCRRPSPPQKKIFPIRFTPLCLRTHYGRHCEPFSSQNALHCRILHIGYDLKFFPGGTIAGLPQRERATPLPQTLPAKPKGVHGGAGPRHRFSAWLTSVPVVTKRPLLQTPIVRRAHLSPCRVEKSSFM